MQFFDSKNEVGTITSDLQFNWSEMYFVFVLQNSVTFIR